MSALRSEYCYLHDQPRVACDSQQLHSDTPIPAFLRAEEPAPEPAQESNPKTLMGRLKVPMLSVLSPASMIAEARALQYGAYEAPRKDGGTGYGPYNWRDQPVEAMVYIDAVLRHLAGWVDGEECATDSLLPHLWHAKASLGILIDAIENETCIDDRPKVRKQSASRLLEEGKARLTQRASPPLSFTFID